VFRGSWQGAQERARFGDRQVVHLDKSGGCDLDLGEAFDPALGQRHFALANLRAECLDADIVGADVQPHWLRANDPRQRCAHSRAEVDVGRANRRR